MSFPSDRPVPTEDLAAILDDLWDRLTEAADRAKPAFHLPTLCTVGEDVTPSGRVVVLRHADRADGAEDGRGGGAVGCHTDVRAPKAAQVRATPRAAWVFYDPRAKLQVRLSGPTRILTDGPAVDAAWEATTPSARRCYLAPHPPGAAADGPEFNLPAAFRDRDPTPAESAPGRAHFALLRTRAEALDWLHLHHAGHRRARFTLADGRWRGTWAAV